MRKRLPALLSLLLLVLGGFLLGRAQADQPHMQAALDHLRGARRQLEVADADKGGHRVKALRLVNEAASEVERGIQFERNH
jgi:hypothetical protein